MFLRSNLFSPMWVETALLEGSILSAGCCCRPEEVEGRNEEERTLVGSPFHQQARPTPPPLGLWSDTKRWKQALCPPWADHCSEKTIQRQAACNKDETVCFRLHTVELLRGYRGGRGREKLQNVYMAGAVREDLGCGLCHSHIASISTLLYSAAA